VNGVCDGVELPDASIARDVAVDTSQPVETIVIDQPENIADAEINADLPTTNFGDQDHDSVDEFETTLIQFDLSSIPAGATILSATMTKTTTDEASEDGGTVRIHRMREAWTEAGVTWLTRNGTDGWLVSGARPPSRDVLSIASFRPEELAREYQILLPNNLVQDWITQPSTNHGVALVRGSSTQHVHLGTKEGVGRSTLTLELVMP